MLSVDIREPKILVTAKPIVDSASLPASGMQQQQQQKQQQQQQQQQPEEQKQQQSQQQSEQAPEKQQIDSVAKAVTIAWPNLLISYDESLHFIDSRGFTVHRLSHTPDMTCIVGYKGLQVFYYFLIRITLQLTLDRGRYSGSAQSQPKCPYSAS